MNNNTNNTIHAEKTIRAYYTDEFVRVYQAYSDPIGKSALANNNFVSPPFKMTRMTWIKPSFLWMAYRAGWGFKEDGQNVILAIDITHEGFLWALEHACLSSFKPDFYKSKAIWQERKAISPVRIQWDPERDIQLNKLDYRSIQIGLSAEAVERYVNEWIINVTDVSGLQADIKHLVDEGKLEEARALLPIEREYEIPADIAKHIGMV